MNWKLWGGGAVLLGFSYLNFQPPEVNLATTSLVVVGLVVGLLSPRTPLGVFPAASSFYLILLVLTGPAIAALAASFGLLVWAVLFSGGEVEKELRLNLLPVLATSGVFNLALLEQGKLLQVSAAGLFYLAVLNACASWQAETLRRGLAWAEIRWAFLRSSMMVPILAGMGVVLVPRHWLWSAGLGALAWFQSGGAVTELLRSQMTPMSEELKSVRGREQKWRDRLTVLDRLSRSLGKAKTVAEAVRSIEESVRNYCGPASVKVRLGAKSGGYPMAGTGVLEVEGELEEEQHGLLTALATTAGFALRTVKAREDKLNSVTQERDQMEAWLSRLRVLLKASQNLASTLSMDSVLETSEATLGKLVNHQGSAILSVSPQRSRGSLSLDDHQAVLTQALKSGEVLKKSGVLIVPVIFEEQARGALLVRADDFDTLDIELVRILAYQLGGAFERARLYEQIVAAESQVVQSSKMAAVGQLAAGIAHELNTPLGTVLMSLEDAAERLPDQPDKAISRIKQAEKSGKKAQDIIAKLLHYSREATLDDQKVELSKVIEYVAESLRYQLNQAEIELKLSVTGEATVRGNENELHQVVSNLVVNSIEALASGDIIEVHLGVVDNRARITVSDAGPGIPEDVQSRVFEPFFTTRNRGAGTGLGLSTALQIVLKHEGTLEFESEPGKTIFRLDLPTV